jgi:o-succinylbenzoate synthase
MTCSWSVQTYSLPLRRPYEWARGRQTERRGLLIRCARDGLVGWGECAPPPDQPFDAQALAARAMAAASSWNPGLELEQHLDATAVPPRLRHALLGAWLDLEAQTAGLPLASFLATCYRVGREPTRRVSVNALLVAGPPETLAAEAAAAVGAGFGCIKVKSHGDATSDVERMRAVRAAVGNRVELRLDANGSWSGPAAAQTLDALAPLALQYVEQPIPASDVGHLVHLARDARTPIALDESATGIEALEPFVAAGARPVVVAKPQRLGGADRTLELMAWCAANRLNVVVTNSLESAVGRAHALHLASLSPSLSFACGLATEGFMARDVGVGPQTLDGLQTVGAAVGLGVRMDADLLEAGRAAALE